jgi:hypothetical protein
MAGIPAGISTALVHLDAPVSFIGEDGRIHATITSSIPLVWAATGTPIGNFIENVSLGPGIPLELNLPHVDQAGFLDGAGNTVTGWSYRIEVTYEKDGQNIPFPARDFQILVGQDEVDLALIPSGEAYIPVVAPILPVTSIEGFTGEVTFEELGLDRVDNTTDAEKPISALALAALNLKADQAAMTTALAEKMVKGSAYLNVMDYGVTATGNLTTGGGTDDTVALRAAITAAKAVNKPLYIPAGTYRTTDMLDLRGVRTYGDGMNRTVIMCTDNTKAVVLAGGGAFYLADLTVRHFSLPNTQTVPEGVGIRVQKLQDRSTIHRVQIYNVTSGIYCYEPFEDTTNYTFSTHFTDIRVDRFTHSIVSIRGFGAGNTGNVFTNIYAQNGNFDGSLNTSIYGWQIGTMADSQFNNINIEWGYYAQGFDVSESYNLFFNGIHFEQYHAKGGTFSAYWNVYGGASYGFSIRGVTLKDCWYESAHAADYALMRIQTGAKIQWDGLISTGGTRTGTTLRKFVFSPAVEGTTIIARGFRLPDATFQTGDYYQSPLLVPAVKMATGILGSGQLYEENGTLRGYTQGGAYRLIAGETVAVSAPYTVKTDDAVVLATAGATELAITLPALAKGARHVIKKIDAGAGRVAIATGVAGKTIDGAGTKYLFLQYDTLTVECDGNQWYVLGQLSELLASPNGTRFRLSVADDGALTTTSI